MIILLIVAIILSFVAIAILLRSNFLGSDVPNERSSHSIVTPRGAGIGFGKKAVKRDPQ